MPSTVKRSFFYTDEKEIGVDKEMSDDFYKEAAQETLKAAVREKLASQQQSQNEEQPQVPPQQPDPPPEAAQLPEVSQPVQPEPQPAVEAPLSPQPDPPAVDDHEDDFDDFDFVDAYDGAPSAEDEQMLPENRARSAISCAFVGVGGGGGKMAKAFLDLGFSKTLLINTTVKDQPEGVSSEHFLLLPGADGVGKDIALGKRILEDNSSMVEDTLRTRVGKVDWIFVLAGGGGGTGSACNILHSTLERHLKSVGGIGSVVYVITKPTAQELLNPTISDNFDSLQDDVRLSTHVVIDNERQLQLLRGKVGILNLYPTANKNFAKLFWNILKLASENSPIQSFDSKDLEKCLSIPGRMVIGSTVVRDVNNHNIGSILFQGCLRSSPCPAPPGRAKTGVMLLIATTSMASDPSISKKLEAAFSYVGGRTDTLFTGVYVKENIPGLIAITIIGGI